MSHARWLVVDLDGTLTQDLPGVGYPAQPPVGPVVEAVRRAQAQGFRVRVLTARGMRTWEGDVAAVEREVRPGVQAWLGAQQVPHDAVTVGKPWCGPGGFYADDRALHPEELVFRFCGPWAGLEIGALLTEPVSPGPARLRVRRIERWLELTNAPGEPLPERARWVLVQTPQTRAAGWFGLHHEGLSRRPLVVPEAGFALIPREDLLSWEALCLRAGGAS
jgi:capsule biosynthesis phosphatase